MRPRARERARTCNDLLVRPRHTFNKRSCDQSERHWALLSFYIPTKTDIWDKSITGKNAFRLGQHEKRGTGLLVTAYIVQHRINIQLILLAVHGRDVQLPTHCITHLVLANKSVDPRTRHSAIAQSVQQVTPHHDMCTVLAHALAADTGTFLGYSSGKRELKPRFVQFEQGAPRLSHFGNIPPARLHVKILVG